MSAALSHSIADDIFNATVAHAPDDNAKSALYQKRYEDDMYQIQNAAKLGLGADDITRLTNDARAQLSAMNALDPTKRFDWYIAQLNKLDDAQKAATASLGEQARTAVETVIDSLQPVVDWFTGLPTAADPAVTSIVSLGGAADRSRPHIEALGESAALAAGRLDSIGSGSTRNLSGASVSSGAGSGPQEVTVHITVTDPNGYVRSVQSRRGAAV
jgi:hypothetical protein